MTQQSPFSDCLSQLETRDGILDRRFYAVCQMERADELRSLLSKGGLSVHPLTGRTLRMLLLASALGGSPQEVDEDAPVNVEIHRRHLRIGGHLTRSLHLGKWPRTLAPGFLQSLMAAGIPMDLSVHLGPIPAEQASRTLEWQKVKFESAQSLSMHRGRTLSSEAEIALEDVSRLRDEVQRGRERLFPRVFVHHPSRQGRNFPQGDDPAGRGRTSPPPWASWTCSRSGSGRDSCPPWPLALNAVAVWAHVGHQLRGETVPLLTPRPGHAGAGTLMGIDLRACAPVVYDAFDGTHLNANTAVLARSGSSGKSFATKLGVLRGLTRGVTAYIIDPEGEYADMARAAGGSGALARVCRDRA